MPRPPTCRPSRARPRRWTSGYRTIEDLLLRLLRVALLAGLVAMALAVFDLTVVLAAIVVVLVAILFATQDVVLDYVMGFLLLVEGPFFKGDYVVVRDHTGVEGVVEEIGLRRTLLRDQNGSSHAVSNGLIRLSSNLTRLFSVAVVELHVLRAADLERALSTAAEVAAVMRREPNLADRFDADAGTDISITGSARMGSRSGSSSAFRRVHRRRSRASFAGGCRPRSLPLRSGPGDGTRRCRSSASPPPAMLPKPGIEPGRGCPQRCLRPSKTGCRRPRRLRFRACMSAGDRPLFTAIATPIATPGPPVPPV